MGRELQLSEPQCKAHQYSVPGDASPVDVCHTARAEYRMIRKGSEQTDTFASIRFASSSITELLPFFLIWD